MNSISVIKKIKYLFLRFLSSIRKTKNSSKTVQNQTKLDKKLVFSLSKSRIPNFGQLKYFYKYLTPKEFFVLKISVAILLISSIMASVQFYRGHLQIMPIKGGIYTEGVVGQPISINPLYAIANDVDDDISKLVYSSLFKYDNNKLVNDLADKYEISKDSKEYIITIRDGVYWHDNTKFSVDDIVFTFNAIKDVKYKSLLRDGFLGVDIEKIDDKKIKFILTEPYAAFLDLLTFGILPAEKWYQINPKLAIISELSKKPIGTGRYKFGSLTKEKSGVIKEYLLEVNDKYYDKKPLIDVSFKFFTNQEELLSALNEELIDGVGFLSIESQKKIIAKKTYSFNKLYLPQSTLLFFNQNKNIALADKAVRQALSYAVAKNEIVNKELSGEAYVINGPILPNNFAYNSEIKKYEYSIKKAQELLDSVDWKIETVTKEQVQDAQNELADATEEKKKSLQKVIAEGVGSWRKKDGNILSVSITTVEKEEYIKVANRIKNDWEKIGVKTEVQLIPASSINFEIISPRNFDTLIYGQVTGADPDPYPFWHSSQAIENGYNIASLNNEEIDKILEEARMSTDKEVRIDKYKQFQKMITEIAPAIFLYSPINEYIVNKRINNLSVSDILTPNDRFNNISDWYIETGKKLVW